MPAALLASWKSAHLTPDDLRTIAQAAARNVKTARAAYVDEILATGGNYTFRFSFQGGTREAHERTTRRPGSRTNLTTR